MVKNLQSFNEHSKNEKLDLSDVRETKDIIGLKEKMNGLLVIMMVMDIGKKLVVIDNTLTSIGKK